MSASSRSREQQQIARDLAASSMLVSQVHAQAEAEARERRERRAVRVIVALAVVCAVLASFHVI